MIETIVMLPARDNRGAPFPRSHWTQLGQDLVEAFGGFTRQSNLAGVWRSPSGRIFRDSNRQYTVSLSSWTQLPAWLGVVLAAQRRFQQEALYIRVAGIPEVLSGTLS